MKIAQIPLRTYLLLLIPIYSSATNFLRRPQGRSCSINFDCPQPACIASPCPVNYCDSGYCHLDFDEDATDRNDEDPPPYGSGGMVPLPLIACTDNSQCEPIQCFVPPCDENNCVNGYCTLEPADREEDITLEDMDGNATISVGVPCGPSICADDEVCCNESCGICTPEFGICTDQFCGNSTWDGSDLDGEDEDETEGVTCGKITCAAGDVCCNPSCSICTPVDGACTMQLCNEEEDNTVGDDGADDGKWITVSRGECDCQELCSVCQETFGLCIQLYCFP